MTSTVLYSHLIGWIITSIGLALATRDRSRPAVVIVAAGAVWPLLVVGAAQFGAVALVTEIARGRSGRKRSEHGMEYTDDELHALIEEWRSGFEQRR